MTRDSAPTPPELQMALSALTLPFILGLVALTAAGQQLRELGEVSEELFRGDRLPVLPLPPLAAAGREDT
ncbi:MAG: hypothetical protein HC838_18250 [Spirulinaceae cyanobacterium RM2_2_10]|nr:hypothetical protein [Spirulinaceae cyanobacterium SM2_1_0]NJO21595.1 hypothetical protein [Spirulinaceae cyanobacterium RM2_2_10]